MLQLLTKANSGVSLLVMSMTAYIKRDLQSALRTGRQLPSDLTLESLAGHYDVSFTPVRAAVAELVAEGVLQKGANRRLSATRLPAQSKILEGPPAELPTNHLDEVGNALVQISLEGETVYLREEAAAERFGISRSAIRNIFHRLAGMGLLTHIPRRGWQVRAFRQEDMQAFLEIRELLEMKAMELAQPRLVDSDLQATLDRNFAPASESEWPQIDNSLHTYIIEKSGNPYIKDFFERQGKYYEILFDWEDQDREIAVETVRQHRQILEALLVRDWHAARSALSWHIRFNHPVLNRIVARHAHRENGNSPRTSHRPGKSERGTGAAVLQPLPAPVY